MSMRNGLPLQLTPTPASFASLCHEISKIPPRPVKSPQHRPASLPASPQALQILRRWVTELRRRFSPLPPNTTAILFRLLFPEEDHRRKYDLQETALARHLSKVLCVATGSAGRGGALKNWAADATLGCLGEEVRKLLQRSTADPECVGPLSFTEMDALLDELASTSAYSCLILRKTHPAPRRPRDAILRSIYSTLPALDAALVTQIVLKDLRPLLYPVAETHFTAALKKYSSVALYVLSKEAAMSVWDPSGGMLRCYRVRSTLDEASASFEEGYGHSAQPKLGVPINIPKCVKGQGCAHALSHFSASKRVWAETKYDGERMQIHVEVDGSQNSNITIFSKSKRNSTWDRIATHWIIREALGLPQREGQEIPGRAEQCRNRTISDIREVVLEAEMVAFSAKDKRIDEFWRIRSLVESSAYGVRGARYISKPVVTDMDVADEPCTQFSMCSDASAGGDRHLALVFFDILYLNSHSLLSEPYTTRRSTLESIVHPVPSYAILAERHEIDISGIGELEGGTEDLRRIFAAAVADHQEGLVLKAAEGRYVDRHLPWVKLKKDYIPGYGDAIDLVIVAAGWDKERARELRVPPTVFTTFYIGSLTNADVVKKSASATPHFEVYFTVSYGLDRDHLEELNYLIKSLEPVKYAASSRALSTVSYTFDLFSGLPSPSVVLSTPLLVELFGAGFTKAAKGKYYELRFPRITKVHRSSERSWQEGMSLDTLQKIARESVGRDRPHKDVDDWCKGLWGKTASPGAKCVMKRKATEASWLEKLEHADVPLKSRRLVAAGRTVRTKTTGRGTTSENVFHGQHQQEDFKMSESQAKPLPLKSACVLGAITSAIVYPNRRQVEEDKMYEKLAKSLKPATVLRSQPLGSVTNIQKTVAPEDAFEYSLHSVREGSHLAIANPLFLAQTAVVTTIVSRATIEAHVRETNIDETRLPSKKDEGVLESRAFSLGAQHPIVQFMASSFVWLARSVNTSRSAARPALAKLIPPDRQLHSFDAFLIGCGWDEGERQLNRTFDFVKYGVIFVDRDQAGSKEEWWSSYALVELKKRESIRGCNTKSFRKPIWVFDTRIIGYEALWRGLDDGEAVEAKSIAHFV